MTYARAQDGLDRDSVAAWPADAQRTAQTLNWSWQARAKNSIQQLSVFVKYTLPRLVFTAYGSVTLLESAVGHAALCATGLMLHLIPQHPFLGIGIGIDLLMQPPGHQITIQVVVQCGFCT